MIPLDVDELLAPGTTIGYTEAEASPEDVEAFVTEGTAFWIEGDSRVAQQRRVGCWMMCVMPQHGLDEALTWLAEAYEFYVTAPDQLLLGAPNTKLKSGEYLPKKERAPLAMED